MKLKAALDEIIKFNCKVNEFNYLHDFVLKLKNQLMPKILLSKLVDWRALFKHYTKESEGLMTKI